MKKVFRCPFETKGIKENTIIEIELSASQAERFAALRGALEKFHRDNRWVAIRLIVPHSVLEGCTSNRELQPRLLPYQAEVIAACLDDALWPHLPHQKKDRKILEGVVGRTSFPERAAKALIREFSSDWPDTMAAFAEWLYLRFQRQHGITAIFEKRWFKKPELVMRFDESAIAVVGETDKVLFSVIKTPFYPREFGRYSERVEIVLNRDIDVARLPISVARRIRREANLVHEEHGVLIDDIEYTQQPTGLWILEEEQRIT